MKYGWKRFWCPREEYFRLDDGGFLADPDTEWGSTINAAVRSFDEISTTHSCLVLLGEPGIGKTTALYDAAEAARSQSSSSGIQVITVNLGEFGSEDRLIREVFHGEDFTRWRTGHNKLQLFIDSLDEGLLHIRVLASLLASQVKKLPIERLSLRIACRTAVWPLFLEQELQNIWETGQNSKKKAVGVYELLPLRRRDVAEAISAKGLSETEFIRTIQEANIVPLAIKPITFSFLIDAAHKSNGVIPLSRTQAYEEGCLALCEERNLSRRAAGYRGKLNAESRRVIAARIAYATLLTGRSAIWTEPRDPNTPETDVVLNDLVGDEIVNGSLTSVDEETLREVLDTGFFSSRGSKRMGWAHQTYAEYLAAWYVVYRRFPRAQTASLFVHPYDAGGKFVPQLHECAAWLASMDSEFFELVLEREPEVLLASDTVRFSVDRRSRIANAFITQVVNGKVRDLDWPRSPKYKRLNHPGLPAQLRAHIMNKTHNRFVRATLVSIANACKLCELMDCLRTIALDKTEHISLRRFAAFGIDDYGDKSAKACLMQLIHGQAVDDPDDELKGIALRALWPYRDDAELFFAELTLPRRNKLYGAYYMFLIKDLVEDLRPEDVPAALRWVQRYVADVRDFAFIEDVMSMITQMAWKHIHRTEVYEAFASLALSQTKYIFKLLPDEGAGLNPFSTNRRESRLLFRKLVETSGKSSEQKAWQNALYRRFQIIGEQDITWVVEQHNGSTDLSVRSSWLEILRSLVGQSKTLSDDALDACRSSQEIMEALKRDLGPITLNSPLAEELRTLHRRWKNEEKDRTKPPKLEPIDVQIRNLLSAIPNDVRWWSRIPRVLEQHPITNPGILAENSDDKKRPAWGYLDDQLRREILDTAIRFLEEVSPEHLELTTPDTFSTFDWAAIDAFLILMEFDLQSFNTISEDTWKKWTPTIIRLPLPSTTDRYALGLELVNEAYQKNPEVVRIEVGNELERRKNSDDWHRLDRFDRCWDVALSRVLIPALTADGVSIGVFRRLANELVKRGDDEAREILAGILEAPDVSSDRRAVSAAALMSHVPAKSWPVIRNAVFDDGEFAEQVLQEYLVRNRHDVTMQITDAISPSEIAELFVWLSLKYPHEYDPERAGFSAVDFREEVARWRDSFITSLVGIGSREACEALRCISAKFPNLDWLPARVVDSEATYRTKTWLAPEPRTILKLANDGSLRHIQSEEHLLNVVVESLARLNQELKGELPTVRFLWALQANSRSFRPVDENTFSDFVARHLIRDLKDSTVIVNREVEIRRGERTDIHVDALILKPNGSVHDKVTVIIETKCSWSQDLATGLTQQLVGRYLKENLCSHGIYAVGWFQSANWDSEDHRKQNANRRKRDDLLSELRRLSDEVAGKGYITRPFLLNCEF